MRTLNYISIFSLFFIVGIIFQSCGESNKTKVSGNGESSISTQNSGENTISVASKCPERALFYMDISTSMKGYVGTGDSRFRGIVSEYLGLCGDTKVSLFGLKAENPISSSEFKTILDEKQISWAGESNLSSMLDSLVNKNGEDVRFLLTDGILSGSNRQIRNSNGGRYNIEHREELENEIKSKFRGHKDLSALLIRYIATFDGNYSCYNNKSVRLNNVDRPFYIIVVGKSSFIKYIERELADTHSVILGKPCTHYAIYGDYTTYETLMFSYRRGVKTNKGDLIIDGAVSNNNRNIQLSCPISELTPDMQTNVFWEKNIELYVKNNEKDSERPIQADSIEIVTPSSGKSVCVLTINARSLKGRELTIKTRFAQPQWIEEFTDEDDLEIGKNKFKQKQTFNLRYFAGGFAALNNSEYLINQTLKFK